MALFLSTYINRIDRKGRLSIPAPFRAILSQSSTQGAVGLKAPHAQTIECFSYERLEKLAAKIDELPLYSETHQDLTATFFASVCPFSFDPEGRMTLSADFITYAGLKNEVAIVGRGHVFQIWDHETFAHYTLEAQERTKKDLKTMQLVLGGG